LVSRLLKQGYRISSKYSLVSGQLLQVFAWAMEMVRNGEFEHVHISFMIASRTKFTPDRLFQ